MAQEDMVLLLVGFVLRPESLAEKDTYHFPAPHCGQQCFRERQEIVRLQREAREW
jgi:hypothetical protein